MDAGRELDALVAEKVLGWTCIADGQFVQQWEQPNHGGLIYSVKEKPSYPPPYSTNIASAWQVVEKLKSDGFSFYIEGGPSDMGWDVNFKKEGNCPECGQFGFCMRTSGQAATVPLAIALASLKAVGVEVS